MIAPRYVRRFWSKVGISGECWVWKGKLRPDGYAEMRVGDRVVLAHRIADELANGPLPPGVKVLHDCPGGDNRACVRHLWRGTQAENLADMVRKGRTVPRVVAGSADGPISAGKARGETSGQSKISAADVREIRRLARTQSTRSLAALHGISPKAVRKIITRETWRHVE